MFKELTKGKFYQFIAVVMVVCLLFTTSASAQVVPLGNSWETKISAELWGVMAEKSDDDLILVWLWLQSVDQEIIASAIHNEKGLDPAIYGDPALFDTVIVLETTRRIEEQVGYERAHLKGEDGMSLIDWAINDIVDEYVMARREIVMREYSAVNDKFVADNICGKQREVIYNSRSTPSLVMEATKDEIVAYAKKEIVVDISLYMELFPEPCLDNVLTQIGADSTNGTKSNKFNSGLGYKGTGITVGIIEHGGQYDPNAPQLQSIHGTRLKLLDANGNQISVPTMPNSHATFVTSIIVGQAATASGITCEGVVPLAMAYQMGVTTHLEFLNGIDTLAAKGCSVINYSAGSTTVGYTTDDRDVDAKIANLGLSFVVAAGNHHTNGNPNNYVMSPGKALNAITVGNADTKGLAVPYSMNSSSSFVQVLSIPNKPDIAAPGTNINAILVQNQVQTSAGTSLSAPLVTGVLAQIMQKDQYARMAASYAKAILLLGADKSAIRTSSSSPSDNANTPAGTGLWVKSGCGLVNAANSITYASTRFTPFFTSPSTNHSPLYMGYVSAGQKIRVVMAIEKINTTLAASLDDIDVYITNSSGSAVASATSIVQNVEIIEYVVTSSGYYYIQVYACSVVNSSVGVVASVQYRIY